VHWILIAHASAGLVGLTTGFLALSVSKGSRLHKRAGRLFVYAMVTMGLLATVISVYEGKSPFGGLFAAYLVFTAMTTVRPLVREPRGMAVGLALFAFLFCVLCFFGGLEAMQSLTGMKDGAPFGMIFFLGIIALLAGAGDLRMIRTGALRGAPRLVRHLWRMCFGLFVASGSFFLGQQRFIPRPVRIPGLLMVLAVLPLVALLYWLWRVRVRHNLRGLALRP
jgi:uncharacterized membrane protein